MNAESRNRHVTDLPLSFFSLTETLANRWTQKNQISPLFFKEGYVLHVLLSHSKLQIISICPMSVLMLRLPAEIIDFIFSFLQKDQAALKSCSAAHPLLSSLAERHLFAYVILYTASHIIPPDPIDGFLVPQLSRCLSERPNLAKYIRSVTIDGGLGRTSYTIFDELSTLLPLLTHSEELSLRKLRWSVLPDKLRSALVSFLQATHIKGIYLAKFDNFPLTLLSNLKHMKTLAIDSSGCSFKHARHAHRITTSLESLSLTDVTLVEYTRWACLGLNGLISLHVNIYPLPDLSLILTACSKSLTSLTLEIDTSCTLFILNLSTTLDLTFPQSKLNTAVAPA